MCLIIILKFTYISYSHLFSRLVSSMIMPLWQFAVNNILRPRYIAANHVWKREKWVALFPLKKSRFVCESLSRMARSPTPVIYFSHFPSFAKQFRRVNACRNFADALLACVFEDRIVKFMHHCDCITATTTITATWKCHARYFHL